MTKSRSDKLNHEPDDLDQVAVAGTLEYLTLMDIVGRRARQSLGERVRTRRREMRLTQKALADQVQINQGFLSEIERDRRRPSGHTLAALSAVLGLPEAVLVGQGPEHDNPQPLETQELPLYGIIPAGRPNIAEAQLEMFPVLRHLWSADRYCLRLTFDSMEPTLKPGDIVLVQYRQDVDPAHVQGRICACLVNGESTLKRVSVEERNRERIVILRGDNPSLPPMVIDRNYEFSIQGVVIKLVSREL